MTKFDEKICWFIIILGISAICVGSVIPVIIGFIVSLIGICGLIFGKKRKYIRANVPRI